MFYGAPFREDVLAAREKVIAQLCDPKSKKEVGKLENFDDPDERCCLGHMCFALIPKTRKDFIEKRNEFTDVVSYGEDKETEAAPREVIDLLGLYSPDGSLWNHDPTDISRTLTCLNDSTDATSQYIGELLQSNIDGEGDENRYWKPLSEYKERL